MAISSNSVVVIATVCMVVGAGVSGCSVTANNIGSGEELTARAPQASDTVVFGRFRLVRNGEEVKLGEGIFANHATLRLSKAGSEKQVKGSVGRNGAFAWLLEPGDYRVSKIGFMGRGDHFLVSTDFVFAAEAGHAAIYVGTIALETRFESGYYGLDIVAEDYSVIDECDLDCESMLALLGLSMDAATIAVAESSN